MAEVYLGKEGEGGGGREGREGEGEGGGGKEGRERGGKGGREGEARTYRKFVLNSWLTFMNGGRSFSTSRTQWTS